MNRNENPTGQRPTAAFILSLLAGALMLLSARIMILTGHMMPPDWLWTGPIEHAGHPAFWTILGVFSGSLVLIGGFVVYMRPGKRRIWGIIIAIASAMAYLADAGGALAVLLGITAGLLAVIWKPTTPGTEQA